MSYPAFGGKMTSTSGKTRRNEPDETDKIDVTSNLLAMSSRDNINSLAVDAAIVSDGSVSPFEALGTVRGATTVGGGHDASTSISDGCGGSKINAAPEAVPLIELSQSKNNTTQKDYYNGSKNDKGKNSHGSNDNKYINSPSKNNQRNTSSNTRHSARPVVKSAYSRSKSSGSVVSVIKNNNGNNGKRGVRSPESTRTEAGQKEFGAGSVKNDSVCEIRGVSRIDNTIERVVEDDERDSMLVSHDGGGDCCNSSSSGSGSGSSRSGKKVCNQCGTSFRDTETRGNGSYKCEVCTGDDDIVDKQRKNQKPRKLFCCVVCNSKVKHGDRNSSMTGSMEEVKYDNNSGRVSPTDGVAKAGVRLKPRVRFAETNVDDEETEVETMKAKVEAGETKVEVKVKKKAVKVNQSADHQYSRVLNMIVHVPYMHLIPDSRRYENYFRIKPEYEVEFGKKPKWIAPRLKHYLTRMGCGTSNQVVSNESKMPIVVFGATGVIGGSVVKALLKDPRFMVKAITRTPTTDQARGLAEIGAVVVPADLNDVRSLQRVMEGAAGVFLTTNFWEHLSKNKELTHGMNAVDAAVSCNVRHFIFQGSDHTRDEDKPCGHLNAKAAIEEYVKETSLAFTSIHLPFLYENLLSLFKPHLVQHGTFTIPIPMGDMSLDCISLHDFARCVVNIFLRPKNHMLKSVQLTGDRMTVQHMADVLNRHFDDRKFVYHKLNPDDFATFDFQGSQDLAAMFEFMQTAPHRDPRITRRIHHSVVCFDKWVADNKQKLFDAMKDTGDDGGS